MNGEQFYEEFKDVLKYLGVGWADMSLITVWCEGDQLKFEYGGRQIAVAMGKEPVGAVIGTCGVCLEDQFHTPSGPVCKNGHGGA